MNRGIALALAAMLGIAGCMAPRVQMMLPGGTAVREGGDTLALAQARLAQGEFGLAIELYRRVLRTAPDDPAATEGLAMAYDQLGRFDLSDTYFQRALALAPRAPGVYQHYAQSLRAQNRLNEADLLIADLAAATDAPAAVVAAPAAAPSPGPAVAPALAALPPPPAGEAGPRLVRLSLSEVRLETTTAAAAPAPRVSHDVAALMAAPLAPPRAPRVVNAVGRRGVATRISGQLARRGWRALDRGDATFRLATSQLVYPPANRAEAMRLARTVPFRVTAHPSDRASRVLFLVGRNALPWDRETPWPQS